MLPEIDLKNRAQLSASLQEVTAGEDGPGEFYAPFAYRNVVTDYGTVLRPEGFTKGQAVACRVGHPNFISQGELRAIGVGNIEINGDEVGLRGQFLGDEYGQMWRNQLTEQMSLGVVPQVSVGMDSATWTLGERDEMTAAELAARSVQGRRADVVVTKTDVLHLALVDAGAMPGARVESALEREREEARLTSERETRAKMAREGRAALLHASLRR